MKRKLFIGVLCIFFVCFACKNVTDEENLGELEQETETSIEKNDDNDKKDIVAGEEKKDDENETQTYDVVNVSIKLNFEQNDIDFEIEKKGTQLSLTCKDSYEDYEWYMGTNLLSNIDKCRIDFNGYEKNVYPIVLFARKNEIVYSSVYYVNFSGTKFVEQSSRTVFPEMSDSYIRNIHLEIADLNSDELISKDFENYDDYKAEILELNKASYKVSVSAQIGNRNFYGCDDIIVDDNQSEYTIQMNLISFETNVSKNGSLNISAYFMTKNKISDAYYSLYQKKDEKYELYSMDKVNGGNLIFIDGENEYAGFKGIQFSLNDIASGDYWLRIDGSTIDGKKKCYQFEYIYIEENQKSEKVIEICDFFDMYNISYDFDGGFFTGENLITQYSSFDSLSFPDKEKMIKPGYEFAGWFFDKELTEKAVNFYEAGNFSSSLNLYAGWEKIENYLEEENDISLKNSKIQVAEENKTFKISFPLENNIAQEIKNNSDLLTVKLYDKKNILIGFTIQNMSFDEGKVSFEIICDLKKSEYYLVEINVYNPVVLKNGFEINKKIFFDKQLIRKK